MYRETMPMPALLTKKQQAEFRIANSAAMAAAHKAGEARNKASLQAAATGQVDAAASGVR